MTAEEASRTVEAETLQGVVKTLPSQVQYTEQKMKMEMEEMKLFMVESLEGRLEKERNLAVIEAARSEQSMLRESVKNLKKMEVYSDKKNDWSC